MMMICPVCQHANRPTAHFCANCRAPLILQSKYRITRLLGRGGFGSVYLAEQIHLGNAPCAVKELLADPQVTPSEAQQSATQFQFEASVLARLNHPTLPRVTDFFNEFNRYYLVMDFVEGDTLQERLERAGAPLPASQTLAWMAELCDALTYLHTQQPNPVIHRDIKPANIKITPDGKLRLIDFGIAKLLAAGVGTVGAARAVSPPYSPIEQYGRGTDARSDIYALGVTMYQLLTNHLPPEAPDRASETIIAPRQLNPTIALNVERVILEALAVKPADRFQDAAELSRALTTAQQQPTMPARQATQSPIPTPVYTLPTPLPIPASGSGQNVLKAIVGIAISGLVVCVLAIGALALLQQPAPTPAPTAAPPTAAVRAPSPALSTATSIVAPKGPKILRIGNNGYPDTLDPQSAAFEREFQVLRLTYEGLVTLDEKGEVLPGAADRWEVSKDGMQMTFHIRDGLKRFDGAPLTARDYEYALRRAMDPRIEDRPYSALLYALAGASGLDQLNTKSSAAEIEKAFASYGVKASDDRNLVVTFNRPIGFWQYITTVPLTFPADKKKIEADPSNWWSKPDGHNGNGPFAISSIEKEKKIVLVANPNYWRGKPKLDRIELSYYTDTTTLLDAFKRGELDMDTSILAENVPTITGDSTLRNDFLRFPTALTYGVALNITRKPFDDVNVRRAFSAALDRDGYVREVLKSVGKPYTRLIPPGIPGAQSDKAGVPAYDANGAAQMLMNAGYGSSGKVDCARLGEVKITFRSSSTLNQTRAQFLADNWGRVLGCAFKIDPMESTAYSNALRDSKTAPQMYIGGWIQDYPHPSSWLADTWACNGLYSKRSGYCNKDFDALLARADQEPGFSKSLLLYQQAEDLLVKDIPMIFLYHAENLYLVKPWVIGPKDHTSTSDRTWAGEWGPVWTYDIDLTKVPSSYPKQ